MVSQRLMDAAREFSKAVEDHLGKSAAMTREQRRECRTDMNKEFLRLWRGHRFKLARIVRQDIREDAIRMMLEGKGEEEIQAAIAISDEREATRLHNYNVSRQSPSSIAAEKARSIRRQAEREERKRKRARERWGGLPHDTRPKQTP